MRPKRVTAVSTALAEPASVPTSASTTAVRSRYPFRLATASAHAAPFQSAATTAMPCSANRRAIPSPIPLAPPVTTATCPLFSKPVLPVRYSVS